MFEGDEPTALVHLVNSGLGIAFIPALIWKSIPEIGVAVHIEEPRCQGELLLLWPKERYLSIAAREFRDFIITYFANQ